MENSPHNPVSRPARRGRKPSRIDISLGNYFLGKLQLSAGFAA
jgi:hypothetical protein